MKVLTKEEEREHYNATIQGGILGGGLGLAFGGLAVYGASRRFHTFNQLTLQFKAFLGLSGGTFGSIIAADRASRKFDEEHNPEKKRFAKELEDRREAEHRGKGTLQLAREWAEENRYPIVFGSWVASMGIAFGLVGRNPYLSGQQKLVQARVYAQGLTLAVLLASFAMEGSDAARGKGRWETIKVLDPNDPTHSHLIEKQVHKERYAGEDQWMEMVEAEERKIKEREKAIKDQEAKDKKAGKAKNVKHVDELHKKQKAAEEKIEEKKNLVP